MTATKANSSSVRLFWPDVDQDGKPRSKSQRNVETFLKRSGAEVYFDQFASRHMIIRDGQTTTLDDAAMLRLFFEAEMEGLRPPKNWFLDCLIYFANENPKHAVRDGINALRWDGERRLDGWLVSHAGGEDTRFAREAFKLAMVAAVRRVRQPGCKFDQIIVLEGPQGGGKSSFLRVLAGGDDYFTDALPIGADDKLTLEIAHGKLIVELGELVGLGKKDRAAVKSFASRQSDRARLSYARTATEALRQFTIWGTTNDTEYLDDPTGNRRFWPLRVGRIDLERLRAERDQLWAEAAAIESTKIPVVLPEELWGEAAAAQRARLVSDTWDEAIEAKLAIFDGRAIKVVTGDVLMAIGVSLDKQDRGAQMRVAALMQKLGFVKAQMGHQRARGWLRGGVEDAVRVRCNEVSGSFQIEGWRS